MDKNKDQLKSNPLITKYKEEIELLKKRNKEYQEEIGLLQIKQDSLEKIIDRTRTAILIGNNKGQIISANNNALKITQLNHEEITKKNIHEILIHEHPVKRQIPDDTDLIDEISNEQVLIKKNGKKIHVSTSIKMLPEGQYQIVIKSINKRKKAELALSEMESRYRQLAENINEVLWTASKNLQILYISGSITKITGFPPEIYYQKPINELITPISYQLLLDTIQKDADLLRTAREDKGKYSISIEIKLFQKYHSSVWVEMTASLIQDHFGETIGYQGIIRNIDAQKRTQENLHKSYLKYNFALKSVGSGVWELNADLTKINIDENLLNILGYQKSEIKPLLNDWITLTYKADRLFIIDTLQDILDGKRDSANYECRRVHKNGEILWFSDYVEAITDEEGMIIELLGTSKNISREKINEEKKFKYYAGLQLLIDSTFHFLKLNDLNQIYNYTGKILGQNIPGSTIIFSQINENEELIPVRIFGIMDPSLKKEADSLIINADYPGCKLNPTVLKLLSQKFIIEFKNGFEEFTLKIPGNQFCTKLKEMYPDYRMFAIGLGNESQISESISIIIRDNEELKNKEFIEAFISLASIIIEKKKLEIELKKTNETKDKFFSIISHDLKNPFNTFIGFSGLIIQNIEKIEKQKILDFAKLIHDAALHSHEMMQNLFEWVRSQKGELIARPSNFDAVGLIISNIKLFSSEAAKKEILINFEPSQELNLYADIDMFNTVLRNLISNALKFTNKGGEIKIDYHILDKDILFRVADNGVGIPKENHDKLFTLYSTKSTKGTHDEKGTGLGLLLCSEFVKLNGGKIQVESEEGKGSVFSFTIPVQK